MRMIRVNVIMVWRPNFPDYPAVIRVWGVQRGPVNLSLSHLEPLEVAAKWIQTVEHLKTEHHPCEIEIMPDARKVLDLPRFIRSDANDKP